MWIWVHLNLKMRRYSQTSCATKNTSQGRGGEGVGVRPRAKRQQYQLSITCKSDTTARPSRLRAPFWSSWTEGSDAVATVDAEAAGVVVDGIVDVVAVPVVVAVVVIPPAVFVTTTRSSSSTNALHTYWIDVIVLSYYHDRAHVIVLSWQGPMLVMASRGGGLIYDWIVRERVMCWRTCGSDVAMANVPAAAQAVRTASLTPSSSISIPTSSPCPSSTSFFVMRASISACAPSWQRISHN